LDHATSYSVPQDTTFRTPVETLKAHYARHVQQIKEQKQTLTTIRVRGGKREQREITVTPVVRRKLNQLLPKLRQFCARAGRFSAADLATIAGVKTVAANKYINILLASEVIESDEKPWAATYTINAHSLRVL
jgi:Fic family protein